MAPLRGPRSRRPEGALDEDAGRGSERDAVALDLRDDGLEERSADGKVRGVEAVLECCDPVGQPCPVELPLLQPGQRRLCGVQFLLGCLPLAADVIQPVRRRFL